MLQVNFVKNFTMLTNYVEIWYVIRPLCLALGKHENAKCTKKQDVLMAFRPELEDFFLIRKYWESKARYMMLLMQASYSTFAWMLN